MNEQTRGMASIGDLPAKVSLLTALAPNEAAKVLQETIERRATIDGPNVLSPRLIEGEVATGRIELELTRRGALGLRERNSFRVRFRGQLVPGDRGSRLDGEIGLRSATLITAIEVGFAFVLAAFWLAAAVPGIGALGRGEARGLGLLILATLVVFVVGSVVYGSVALSKRGARSDARALIGYLADQLGRPIS